VGQKLAMALFDPTILERESLARWAGEIRRAHSYGRTNRLVLPGPVAQGWEVFGGRSL
jgi:hypothetical protein